MKRLLFIFTLTFFACLSATAQYVTGHVTDSKSKEGVPFANVYYEGTTTGVQTDVDGNYKIRFRQGGKLCVSCVGYETTSQRVKAAGELDVALKPLDFNIGEAQVVAKKGKYSRKNNPAVELMKKVIANKKNQDLHQHDYYSVEQYSKIDFALADVTPNVFEEGKFKRMPFLKDHVELSPETGKLILPLSVDETVTQQIYRKSDNTEKNIVLGKRETGIQELINTGDIFTQLLADIITEVNLYDDNVRLLQYQFISPLSKKDAISFYRFFIADTTFIEGVKCIEVQFTPNNSQDFGFSGEMYVTADSTYLVKRVDMGVPVHTGINFVDLMQITQVYEQLPTGEQVLIKDDMLVVIKLTKNNGKMQAKRTTEYSGFDFDPIDDRMFKFKGNTKMAADAQMKEDSFWDEHRTEELTQSETKMSLFLDRLQQMKGFKPVIWVMKAFIENFVETSLDPKKPSKVDFGPVNTTIGWNDVDGLRLRVSALTTANLNPHFFMNGYLAYGFKDQRWKGQASATYSFNAKKYLPREFPMNNLTFTYTNDVMSPSDIHLPTDKDNVFVALKWCTVDHMMYNESMKLTYDYELSNSLHFTARINHDRNEPTSALFYQPVSNGLHTTYDEALGKYVVPDAVSHFEGQGKAYDEYFTRPIYNPDLMAQFDPTSPDYRTIASHLNLRDLTTTDLTLSLQFQPGAEYLNTKQRRILVNRDAPLFAVSHTVGIKGVWSDYTYNNTELEVYKRWWVKSWGKIDTRVKFGAQWNKVPYPLLCMPWANTSYIKENNMFSLIENMEFMNDRYASMMFNWDLNGKILNRIPLIRRLKWREYFGVNCLWGTLTDKNNPYLEKNAGDSRLYYFPSRWKSGTGYEQQSEIMNPRKPYVEVYVGLHNIFKILWIDYVHRLTYIHDDASVYGKTQKWGIRFCLRMTF